MEIKKTFFFLAIIDFLHESRTVQCPNDVPLIFKCPSVQISSPFPLNSWNDYFLLQHARSFHPPQENIALVPPPFPLIHRKADWRAKGSVWAERRKRKEGSEVREREVKEDH